MALLPKNQFTLSDCDCKRDSGANPGFPIGAPTPLGGANPIRGRRRLTRVLLTKGIGSVWVGDEGVFGGC